MVNRMDREKKLKTVNPESEFDEGVAIEKGFEQMEMIYRSRCIQPPHGNNVTVRDIEKPRNTKEK